MGPSDADAKTRPSPTSTVYQTQPYRLKMAVPLSTPRGQVKGDKHEDITGEDEKDVETVRLFSEVSEAGDKGA